MMSAKNLRDSILQMAVEGKLVEQREEEGTAADLLASIREQRAQLVREKKAKPVKGGESVIWRDDEGHWFERRGKGEAVCIDDEIPFDIPEELEHEMPFRQEDKIYEKILFRIICNRID